MVYLVCLFMKTHLLVLDLLQDNCLDLLCCAFLHKLSGYMRNITVFCRHLLWPILSAFLANTDISVKPKYQPKIGIISVNPYKLSLSFSHIRIASYHIVFF